MQIVYKSKIDLWLLGIFSIVFCFTAFLAWSISKSFELTPISLIISYVGIGIMSLLLPVWSLVRTYYVIDGQKLSIYSGPFRWHIDTHTIITIEPSKSLLSGPALSLDRLAIRYGNNKTILVSPKDKVSFIAELDKRR
ncbi:PH domain-containing protein [Flocculibacter collagenilyticus]|uniref:PH domain-containing protein n=1 Tax=Flocculibacter collagenilyticus TaxID=2744479 RepID=UPI0018F3EE42|nr:PH domain-containing protein [Flocculibacter collagenilyticus]